MAERKQSASEETHYVFTAEEFAVLQQIGAERREAEGRMQVVLRLIVAQQKLKGKYEVDPSGTKLVPIPEKKVVGSAPQ